MGDGALLPLFPLPVVLLPGAALPLHIFEERYRLMVGEAARDHSEFGVILVQDGKLSTAGCTAVVESVVKQYDDGRFDVATTGRRRYQTLSLDQTKAYLQARVEFFEDEDASPPDAARLKRVVRLGRRVVRMLRSSWPDLAKTTQPSFVIANHLPLDFAFKQQLLVQRSENERLEALADHLGDLSQRLETIQRTQQVARTNGQAGRH
jgi:ATP-dependent Lon protease